MGLLRAACGLQVAARCQAETFHRKGRQELPQRALRNAESKTDRIPRCRVKPGLGQLGLTLSRAENLLHIFWSEELRDRDGLRK